MCYWEAAGALRSLGRDGEEAVGLTKALQSGSGRGGEQHPGMEVALILGPNSSPSWLGKGKEFPSNSVYCCW